VRRRRSIHFVPGGNDKMLNKALGLPADSLILDLEDILNRRVEVVTEQGLNRYIRDRVLREAVPL